MILTTNLAKAKKGWAAIGLAAALSACATSTDYPDFTVPAASAEQGRVSMRFPGVAVPELRAPEAPQESLPPELDARLAAINVRAQSAMAAFSANAGAAERLAQATASSSVESDSWALAQVRLADLTTYHSRAHIALADLDELAAIAELSDGTSAEAADIASLRAELESAIGEQARALNAIAAALSQ